MFNLLGNLILSRDLLDPSLEVASEFFRAMVGLMEWSGQINVVDLFPFPWLRWLDPQWLRKKGEWDIGKALEIASTFVKERLQDQNREDGGIEKDFLDVLIKFEGYGKDEPAKMSDHDIHILILVSMLN